MSVDDWAAPALRTVTFLDALAMDVTVDRVLNEPMTIKVSVPSDSPEVYITDTDGSPFVAEGLRVLVGMRDENPGSTAQWVPRACGIILQPTDAGDTSTGSGSAYTDITAFDPWQLLYR